MTSPARQAERVALVSLGITCALAIGKVAVWALTGSLAVLSQALDSVLDVVAIALVFVGVRIAAKPADETHHYGHGKAENLVAFTQTLILAAIVAGVALEAVLRLGGDSDPPTTPWYAFALLAGSAAIDLWRASQLRAAGRAAGSDALNAGALNIATDVGTALVALASLGAVRAGIERADAVGGLLVAAAVAVAAARVGKRSVDVLMDRAPEVGAEEIERAAAGAPGVSETRRVRVRSAGGRYFADVTVATGRTASLERAHDVAEGVERAISEIAPGTDVVVHVEPVAETSGFVERVRAAASRVEGVHEIHNVHVHAFNEGRDRKLHVTLHAKVESRLSLEGAHDMSDRIEYAVAAELGPHVRVDSHIEPLTSTELGRDVTSAHGELVEDLRRIASMETDVLDCHEVIVTEAGGGLAVVAHVRGRRDLPLARIHDASERIEKALAVNRADVTSVLIHFEPA